MIYLIGPIGHEMGAGQYLAVVHGRKGGVPPRLRYELEMGVQSAVGTLIRQGLVKSAHDCSEGGLGVALAECCISGERKIGAAVRFGHQALRFDQILFNESQSRVVISVRAEDTGATEAVCAAAKVPFARLGEVGGLDLIVSTEQEMLRWDVAQLHQTWYFSIERAMCASET